MIDGLKQLFNGCERGTTTDHLCPSVAEKYQNNFPFIPGRGTCTVKHALLLVNK